MITVHRQGFNKAQDKMIDEAVALGIKVRASSAFASGIAALNEPKLVTHLVQPEILKLDLQFYRPWNPFTSADAYAEKGTIYLNRNAFKRGLPELVGTLFHERTHLEPMNYTHGFYKSKERDASIPYQVGSLVLGIARRLA